MAEECKGCAAAAQGMNQLTPEQQPSQDQKMSVNHKQMFDQARQTPAGQVTGSLDMNVGNNR